MRFETMTAEKTLAVLIDNRDQTNRHLEQIGRQLKNAAEMGIIAAIIQAVALQLPQTMRFIIGNGEIGIWGHRASSINSPKRS